MNLNYLMQYVSYQLHTIIRIWPHPIRIAYEPNVFCGRPGFVDSFYQPEILTHILKGNHICPDTPFLFTVKRKICYAFLPSAEKDFLIGPVKFSSPIHINYDITDISLADTDLDNIPVCDFSDFSNQILLVYNLQHTNILTLDELIVENCINTSEDNSFMEDFSALVFDLHENEQTHNPYDQELREFTSIEHGDVNMLKKSLSEDYTGKLGTLADDKVRNMRNFGIVVTTLASRAAIRGGLHPEISFSLCDVLIRKLESISDLAVLLHTIRQAEFKYAEMVNEINTQGAQKKKSNPKVEECKDYIYHHLHGKIRIQDIANALFLNANYLSNIFQKQEGISITDFILKEKVNLTQNLLIYSIYTYSEIAAYLGFSSQSHLGHTFKKFTGMTLREYRIKYGIKNSSWM